LLTVVALLAIIGIVALIITTIKPLHEGISEEVFWKIGGNRDVMEAHKAKTLYKAMLKVDLVVLLLADNTFFFLCYDIQKHNYQLKIFYWFFCIMFIVASFLNNIHGHIMIKIDRLKWMWPYFFVRILLEIGFAYMGMITHYKKTFAWQDVTIDEDDVLF